MPSRRIAEHSQGFILGYFRPSLPEELRCILRYSLYLGQFS